MDLAELHRCRKFGTCISVSAEQGPSFQQSDGNIPTAIAVKLPMEEKFEECILEDNEEADLSQNISCPLQCLITLENKS